MRITEPTLNAPCWVDLSTNAPEAAKRFYGELFGWTPESEPHPDAGGYTLCYLDDDPVAAVAPVMSSEQPVAWGVQMLTDDVDGAAQRVTGNGGSVLMGPMDVLDLGRFATAADPAGAVFGLWQARAFAGAGRFNSVGSMSWVELATSDPDGAHSFYRQVFGWSAEAGREEGAATTFAVEGQEFASLVSVGEQVPAGYAPHWMVYFEVREVEDTANAATAMGGQVRVSPGAFGATGRYAVLTDPQGAVFAVRSD